MANEADLLEAGSESCLLEAPKQPQSHQEQAAEAQSLTFDDLGRALLRLAIEREHYAGYPLPDDTCPLKVHDRFPYKGIENITTSSDDDQRPPWIDDAAWQRIQEEVAAEGDCEIINHWFSERSQEDVVIYRTAQGKLKHSVTQNGPGKRAKLLLSTVGVSRCWDVNAEWKAMEKLQELIKPHLFDYYVMTGTFLERSPRSNVLYLFRRCRPTIAVGRDQKVLCSLCLHTIGYYQGSFGGAMVPTDDVISHLLLMRGDEHALWKQANQHNVWLPESGI